ncbi:excinuclease ABC subunit UvrA [Nocardia terpenica]|uniref:ATP-binding cassette domain-containing protein n=1 Tax=Nocardia terpenica TaxID=455432 RepID=UPI001893B6EB|nr:excinuclease ABC subunit UvrA [Nocardia terpenica]MBF6061213.1 excinuclease ABC subunit UvrA [Nocardia terpenica]MBF6105558.1 excinuclease ABC subunit UvrA [Nocardia terpenica]MBF6112972.1 excinuclease ABC subunit UvrA [Nocardia terpenica]MBF6119102.1 excinuclease ABC subunit UvrA [Nocardia terpenica]MBF6152750.1 excinuclease ABC subunit UvrA [Nocardia terpenica]
MPDLSTATIRVRGAREHNLRNISLDIPKNKITVFTGVSGSGKSSLVFDTIAVESQRQLYATFPAFILNFLPRYERPHAEAIDNLTAPVIIDQQPVGGGPRSTVGTMTDIYSMVRALFARFGAPSTGLVYDYSFNTPQGMCPECDGLGVTVRADPDKLVDRSRSLNEGAILLPGYAVGVGEWQMYGASGRFDPDKALADYSDEEWHDLLYGSGGKVELAYSKGTWKANYEGLAVKFTRSKVKRDTSALSEKTREQIQRFLTQDICPACDGARLNATALATRLNGRTIADWTRLEITDLMAVLDEVNDPAARGLAEATRVALARVADIGLGYLSLDRATSTLSGGEGQRLKMIKHLGSALIGMTYIFDEPSVGLHPRDVGRLNRMLEALRDKGNTVLVVEHDPDVIEIADHIVDVGPRAGAHGGEVVFTGTFAELRAADTLTGRGLRRAFRVKDAFRRPGGALPVVGARAHNLKDVTVDVPTGVLTVVTGVAGSGKSSLIRDEFMARYPESIHVDQSAIGASSRSTPATYLGLMDPIRKLFAKATGQPAALFSFNSAGACPECGGRGVLITEVAYMDPVTTHCESCDGRRFCEQVLAHRLRGSSIAEVLAMSAEQAVDFFPEKALRARLRTMIEVGLPYLSLGQAMSTLSGGERQRIKLATQLQRTGSVYVLDEPTTGLHMSDVDTLLALLDSLVDRGNTVLVIEHDLNVVGHADWVIDLGPDGGKNGGEIVFTGTPADLLHDPVSLTGEYLRKHEAARRSPDR